MAENKDESSSVSRKRKPNWTTDECLFLSKLVDENRSVLRSKFGTGVTTVKKKEIWRKITDAINATSSTKRSVEEVEKKWHNLQIKGKAEIADARRSAKITGNETILYHAQISRGQPPPSGKIQTFKFT